MAKPLKKFEREVWKDKQGQTIRVWESDQQSAECTYEELVSMDSYGLWTSEDGKDSLHFRPWHKVGEISWYRDDQDLK